MILKVNSLIKKLFLNQYLEKEVEQRFPSLPESPQRTSISVHLKSGVYCIYQSHNGLYQNRNDYDNQLILTGRR